MNLAEEAHMVLALSPQDVTGGAWETDYFNLKNYGHASIIIAAGTTGGTMDITVEESDDSSGSNTNAIAFYYYAETTDSGDTLGDRTSADTDGFTTSANDNIFYVIDIDASELTDDYPYLIVKGSNPGGSTDVAVVAILSDARYGAENTPTAIT